MLASGSLKRSAKIPLVIKYMGIRDTCFSVQINLKHTYWDLVKEEKLKQNYALCHPEFVNRNNRKYN